MVIGLSRLLKTTRSRVNLEGVRPNKFRRVISG